jgi:hypothetical protein
MPRDKPRVFIVLFLSSSKLVAVLLHVFKGGWVAFLPIGRSQETFTCPGGYNEKH